MPNCDFYATPEDHDGLLSWLFSEQTCYVYELSSTPEQPLRRFESPSEVLEQFDRRHSSGEKWSMVNLQLYVLGAGPPFSPRRIHLDPKHCDGATYRYAAEGWGLVQLYLSSPKLDCLDNSHTNHNSRKRAEAWGKRADVATWDFERIAAFSSRLNRQIRQRSAAKIGSRPVLPNALKLWQAGYTLLPWKPAESQLNMIVSA